MDALRRPACAAWLASILVTLALAAPAGGVHLRPVKGPTEAKIGIADQKPSALDDPRFRELGIGYVRRSVAWDALRFSHQRHELDDWVRAARLAGADPLITFARSSGDRRRHAPPGPSEFQRQFRRFRARYPDVKTYSAWNEANECGTGTCRRPDLVARYYDTIRRVCPTCKVLAADLLDQPNLASWARAFRRATKVEPRYWGLHDYIDANRFVTTRTEQLLHAVAGQVWLTEIGGLVARRNHSSIKLPQGRAHAASATHFILERLARVSPRIARIYIYHWSASTAEDSWDSALIGRDDRPRAAFFVLRRLLRAREAADR